MHWAKCSDRLKLSWQQELTGADCMQLPSLSILNELVALAARWQVLELSWQLSAMLLASLATLSAGKL